MHRGKLSASPPADKGDEFRIPFLTPPKQFGGGSPAQDSRRISGCARQEPEKSSYRAAVSRSVRDRDSGVARDPGFC
jgi:hypothetical protein